MKQETVKETTKTKAPPVADADQKAVAVRTPQEMQAFNDEFASEKLDTSDVKIAKILLMQGSSELVKSKKFQAGDMVRSTDSTIIAREGEAVNLVVFKKWKSWRNMELVGKRYEWRGEEPLTAENANAEWDYTKDGKTMRRDKTFNFYGILASEAKSGLTFPVKLSFSRGTIKAGEVLADLYERQLAYQKKPYETEISLTTKLHTNKNGDSYNIFVAEAIGPASQALQNEASKWRRITNNQTITEHVVQETEEATTTSSDEF